ncbi:peptidyl-prolyl cis-trans isomerase [Bacillus stercoris]|uniref:peptidyl-prolyl cis-trans isomerase n=1 Tax=Bacillus stercoris TaxID=2054641 RepID=UPI001FB406A1|nr:peptidyl-prolyl cis-trans isomerase [Bacillus stercoris]MEC2059509.1 peptidyl-prolyl cis-trans isomerase [Bacillus stercoris]MEC2110297.1 peptidyl-prolyl cis-trans isomerase [Bacillus stercoris]
MSVIQVKGNVTYPITIDPSVWIFDDRKFLFDRKGDSQDTLQSTGDESELDSERVIREGRIAPPTLKTEKQYEKQKLMNGSFAMRLGTVLKNAEPNSSATQCVFVTSSGKAAVSLETALNSVVHFSEAGKPIQEGGPVHIYFEDPVHHKQPITDLKEIEII